MISAHVLRGGGPGGKVSVLKKQSSSFSHPALKTSMFSDGAQCRVSHLFSPARPLIKSQAGTTVFNQDIPTIRGMFWPRPVWGLRRESEWKQS